MKTLLITNLLNFPSKIWLNGTLIETVIHHNPWGFSRSEIAKSVRLLLEDVRSNKEMELKIFVCIKPLFFGRRGGIVLEEVKRIFPADSVFEVSPSQLELFSDNPSV
jgi:hypothetical protein